MSFFVSRSEACAGRIDLCRVTATRSRYHVGKMHRIRKRPANYEAFVEKSAPVLSSNFIIQFFGNQIFGIAGNNQFFIGRDYKMH